MGFRNQEVKKVSALKPRSHIEVSTLKRLRMKFHQSRLLIKILKIFKNTFIA